MSASGGGLPASPLPEAHNAAHTQPARLKGNQRGEVDKKTRVMRAHSPWLIALDRCFFLVAALIHQGFFLDPRHHIAELLTHVFNWMLIS